MDIISIVILSLIVSAFILFGSVLMYGDYVSQQARRTQHLSARPGFDEDAFCTSGHIGAIKEC